MDESDAQFDYVEILGTRYPMNFTINRTTTSMYTELLSTLPTGITNFTICWSIRIFDKRNQYWITIKALGNVADSVTFKVIGSGYEYGAFLKLNLIDSCVNTCASNHTCYDGVTLTDNTINKLKWVGII